MTDLYVEIADDSDLAYLLHQVSDESDRAKLRQVIQVLSTTLERPGIVQWLTRPNGYLHGRVPEKIILDEKGIDLVAEAANAYVQGYFV